MQDISGVSDVYISLALSFQAGSGIVNEHAIEKQTACLSFAVQMIA